MLIIALVLALIGLVALVFAVVTSNQLVAWVCIGASVLGVILLIVDAIRERQQRDSGTRTEEPDDQVDEVDDEPLDYPEEAEEAETAAHSGADATPSPAGESSVAGDDAAK
ncbi:MULTISPECIES: hypothetical protein [Mycobacterium]|uniref:Transmembrane protein n=1 Tax=Mycobacterium kiyosense TaxID=2871094 RepID=A0A9P3Q9G7_9MYCO|nr:MULTISPECIES: hypothetical protein [Mycobacterium]BDB42093.1 hypothetical protein IWGMT90018_25390 [Mycobacterium kiyosense]BDE14629.1 hypothetical protein MKCMC460_34890 [Mycobacterium sp. 20KCMC460]GLB81314.1 hypothetical protein SRL2020028_05700 [Mycobacterium kiyosense]GLB90790.1 hypothetical protein SRL2020130_36070 [Mycobacterium kiyosense]GLB96119.1 hypothetical protein SRL2020226_28950 [Mycobacterium kiyosense]